MKKDEKDNNKKQRSIITSFYKAFRSFAEVSPILLGVILLLGLSQIFVSKQMVSRIFTGRLLQDTVIGSTIGSIFTGSPITSYIIGGELLKEGVSLLAVTAFIVAWVTVGIVQFPAEVATLGKQFAIIRNILSFILSILVASATVATLMVIK